MLYSIGGIILICGILFKLFPPRKINSFYGYRTFLTMKNEDTWREAQRYSANSFIVTGAIILIFSLLFKLAGINSGSTKLIALAAVVIMLVVDEIHMRKVFDSEGNRKIK